MKIIAINRLLTTNVGTTPSIDIIADSAVIKDGKPLFIPNFSNNWTAEATIAIRISRLGKNIGAKFASRYYDAITTVLRIKPTDCKSNNTALYTSFDGSIIMGNWETINSSELNITIADKKYTFSIDDLDIDNAIATISKYITLKIGDVIILGHYADNINISIDNSIIINLNETENLKVKIK